MVAFETRDFGREIERGGRRRHGTGRERHHGERGTRLPREQRVDLLAAERELLGPLDDTSRRHLADALRRLLGAYAVQGSAGDDV